MKRREEALHQGWGNVALKERGPGPVSVKDWTLENIEASYRGLIEREGIKGGDIIHPTRLALTGKTVGPSLFELIEILCKEESVETRGGFLRGG